jgi:glucose-1-phosphate adenylyltransferase
MTALASLFSINSSYSEGAREDSYDMKRVASIILGGGQGSRLYPLTMSRCKPAMSFGGRYRLIDIPISNALNSGCQKIFIITQFLSSSLHQHIFATYRFGSSGLIELLPVEEKHKDKSWFEGTADAVRKNLEYLIDTGAEYFLILSGDQLYRMDFRDLLRFARKIDADAVIATLPVTEKEAKRMGIMQIDSSYKIISFHEKPQSKADLDKMRLHADINCPCNKESFLGSMGIYLFKRKVLVDLLKKDPREDFGKHLIPSLVREGRAAAYIYQGYWEDIGTVESFHKANIALTHSQPVFDCYNEEWPFFAHHTTLPGARFFNTQISSSIVCEGSIIEEGEVSHSTLLPLR